MSTPHDAAVDTRTEVPRLDGSAGSPGTGGVTQAGGTTAAGGATGAGGATAAGGVTGAGGATSLDAARSDATSDLPWVPVDSAVLDSAGPEEADTAGAPDRPALDRAEDRPADAGGEAGRPSCPPSRPMDGTECDSALGGACSYPSTINPGSVVCLCGSTWRCYG